MGASLAKQVASLCVLFGLCACGATSKGAERPSEASTSSPSSSPGPNGVSSSVEDPSRLALGSSDCYIKTWFEDAEMRVKRAGVVMPDGSMVVDFSSESGAQIVQRCFYDAGLTPGDAMALLLVERVLWRGGPLFILRYETERPDLYSKYEATWTAPVVERQDNGYVARFQAVDPNSGRLLSVVATVTPASVDFVVDELGGPTFVGSTTD